MALSPFSFMRPVYRDFWDFDHPQRVMDQYFGLGLSDRDLLPPVSYRGFMLRPRTETNISASGISEVISEKDKFKVMLNVKQFSPEEITVKTVDNAIVIHGKHEEKQDEHGFVSREFNRRYMLPEGVNPEKVTSSLSPDGVLTISAPRQKKDVPQNERVVPITLQPSADAVTVPPKAPEQPKAEEVSESGGK